MMMSEGAGELNSTVVAAAAVLPRATSVGAQTMVPIILCATESEATGARMQVGGLRVVDRAVRLLARSRLSYPRLLPIGTSIAALASSSGHGGVLISHRKTLEDLCA